MIHRPSILWFLLAAPFLEAQNAILLNHANVIDGFSDQPIRDAAVLVENGRIAALAPNFEKLPADTVAIDLSGRWLLPGLIDAHVHLTELRAGISPMDAIKAATSRAAECLGISTRTGSIRRGYEADLVVVEGDPLRNIEALKKVMLVINDGQISVNSLRR